MRTPYAPRRTGILWLAAALVAVGYGVLVVLTALRLPAGAELTHPIARERRWLIGALVLSAAGDFVVPPVVIRGAAVPIWWAYATSLLLITAGFFFGRTSDPSARR